MRTCGFEVAVGEGKKGKMCPCVCVHVLVYGEGRICPDFI